MTSMTDPQLSRARQHLRTLAQEYAALTDEMLGREPLVRGTLNWHQRPSGKYPGITRGVGGTVVGRRVRLDHVAWLEPLLARHKTYRHAQARLRAVHAQVLQLTGQIRLARLYDYEPQAVRQGHLRKVRAESEDRHGA